MAVLSAAVALAGCGGAIPGDEPGRTNALEEAGDEDLVLHKVAPVGLAGTQWPDEHYVWLDRAADHRSRLFVHMPGTCNAPSSFQLLAKEAARLGYHVIVLSYPNAYTFLLPKPGKCADIGTIEAICRGFPDVDACQENVHLQVLDGRSGMTGGQPVSSPAMQVTPAESIEGRLTNLLVWLADEKQSNVPKSEGWSRFLRHGSPDWKRIVISGSAFGGSQAALLAKLRRVARVTLFAAPRDGAGGRASRWLAIGETPSKRYFGLTHEQDLIGKAQTMANWHALDMFRFGETVREDEVAAPFEGTHVLLTNRTPTGGDFKNAIPSVSRDGFTPVVAGAPLLGPAWRYMLGERPDEEDGQDD
jgi:hypothetical protein